MTNKQEFKLSQDEKLTLLKDLVAFKSVNDGELEVAKYLQNYLAKYDIDAEILPINQTRANLIAKVGTGLPVFAISGHMDVVSEVDATKWDTDPFQLTEKDGQLYGRGAADMKSGLAAMVTTLIELKQNGLPKHGTVKLMATVGEEVGGYGSQEFQKNGDTDDIDSLIVGEPSNHEIIYAHRGSMDIRLTSKGTVAHSSSPEKGYNALNPLLEILAEAKHTFEKATEENSELGQLTYNTTILNSGDQVNSIPDLAVAEMNARTIPEYSNQKVEQVLQKLVEQQNQAGAKVYMDVYMSEMPVVKNANNKMTDLAQRIGQEKLGVPFVKRPSAGVTDASNLLKDKTDADFPFMMFGPGNYGIAHKINEFVEKQDYLTFSDIYEALIVEYLDEK